MPNRLVNPMITRVALCKTGKNPEAHQVLWKAADRPDDAALMAKALETEGAELHEAFTKKAYTAAQRRAMAKAGTAMPDGSFPIADATDLGNAIRLARTPAQRAFVRKRAAALGATAKIPDSWAKAKQFTESRLGRLREAHQAIAAVLDEAGGKEDPVPDKIDKASLKLDGLDESITKYLEQVEAERDEALEKAKAPAAPAVPEDADEFTKAISDPTLPEGVRKALTAEHEARVTAQAAFEKAQEDAAVAARIEKAKGLGLDGVDPTELGSVLRSLEKADPEGAAKMDQVLGAVAEQRKANERILRQYGKATGLTGDGSALGKLEALAKARFDAQQAAGAEGATFQKAFTQILEDPSHQALVAEYREERAASTR